MSAPAPAPALTAVLDELDELDELRAKATPGPWGLQFNEWMDGSRVVAMDDDSEDDGITPESAWNDAVLIVAAVNRLPELTAALRAVWALCSANESAARELLGLAPDRRIDANVSSADLRRLITTALEAS